jgi:hypothetical protein
MDDISQNILELIQKSYSSGKADSRKLSEIMEKLEKGTATYDDANKYASELGDILAAAFDKITQDMLPEGVPDYNTAHGLVRPPLTQGYADIADITEDIQSQLNADAGIGIKAVRPDIDSDRIDGIAKHVSESGNFDGMMSFIKSASKNFIQHHVDESVRQNAEFQSGAGMSPKIIRKSTGHCCEWCSRLVGTYSYPDNVPADVYRRHKNCYCTVEYHPDKGRAQNVHTKKWTDVSNDDEIEERKSLGTYLERKKWITAQIEDATEQYLQNAIPKSGSVSLGDNVKYLDEDIETANWIVKNFGGDVKLLPASNRVKTPDSYWNGTYWEFKRCSSNSTMEARIRKAVEQLSETLEREGRQGKAAGIVLDISNMDVGEDEAVDTVARYIAKRNKGALDVIIRKGNDIVRVLRYR